MTKRTVLAGLAALVATTTAVAFADPAAADDTATTTAPADEADLDGRLEVVCARVPLVTDRATRAVERITGDEDVAGSLLWLDQRAATARSNGREQLATVLENRRNTREARIEVLELRLTELHDIAEICDERGHGQ